ncbi:GNAT family N-acetyltransferase [Streptomyces fuscichromogenes]|uniref:Lysine N-acyltransferase MbtK n=1 Tax=Streptomyces fuscichromogenes TaxID=1324013 RepID=A0A918CQC4_9ACTN|nr:GNAT family N-acetyltransferase [Streptomyces fuscichromogenes]GGM99301.1 N-acetyltransferase [Streptomyces fuscichromogenes]
MPPTDASAGTGPVPVHPGPPGHPGYPGSSGTAEDIRDCEDTLDLRLPDEFLALIAGRTPDADERVPGLAQDRPGPLDAHDLLDQVGTWGPTETPVGPFQLLPVHAERDLPIISGWMNDPAVAAFWQLAGSPVHTEEHLRAQLAGDGRSVPCLGVLDGVPMSYWEIYRADLDPLARCYPARPHDTGVHLLVGDVADRGRGLGSALLRAVADLVLDQRPACARVVAEPDLHNTPSVAAFLNAGFRYAAEVDLPCKRAALMMRDRSLRHLM